MKTKKSVLILAGIIILLLSSCVGRGRNIETFADPSVPIEVQVGQEFQIALEVSCIEPIIWEQDYDKSLLDLKGTIGATYIASGPTYIDLPDYSCPLLGPGAVNLVRFETLKPGATQVRIIYRLTQEGAPTSEEVFIVNIR